MIRPESVAIIVPTRNSAATLPACLASIRRQTYPHVELIVVDRASTDDTCKIARSFGARLLEAGPERSAQRNAGARATGAPWVLFIDSDMVLEQEVVERAVDAASADGAIVVPEHGFEDRFLTRVRALEKRCYVGNDDVEAPRFFPRSVFLEIGGYDEAISAGEDWDLADRWKAAGGSVARITAGILHDDRSLTFGVLMRKRYAYGKLFVAFLRKRGSGGLTHLRPGRFLPKTRLLMRSPLTGAAMLALKAFETLSFGLGLLVGMVASRRDAVDHA